MKYDTTTTAKLVDYWTNLGATIPDLAKMLEVPERSIIAKLSQLGLYKRKEYVDKQGNPPIKKEEYVERIAQLLKTNLDQLESLEKVNKNVLKLLEQALSVEKQQ